MSTEINLMVRRIIAHAMLVALAWCLNWLKVSGRALVWAGWGLIYTGWGNTVFYWAGNLASNRGLSVTDTVFGPGDLMGALSYFGGASAMFATFIAVIILARTALRGE